MESSGISHTFSITALILASCLVALGCRLAFHPLRRYRGPFIAKFTDGYGGFHAFKRQIHLATYRDFRKYGSVYRQAPNRLVFNTLTAAQDIYLNQGINKAKHSVVATPQSHVPSSIFGTLDKELHRQKRKVYGQVLSERSVRNFEPSMAVRVDVFLRAVLSQETEPTNMSHLCERLAVDVATELTWGESLETQTQPKNRAFTTSMAAFHAIINFYIAWPAFLPTWNLLLLLNQQRTESFDAPLQRVANDRIALPNDAKHDFYSLLAVDTKPSKKELPDTALWTESVFFLSAGTATMSAALSASFFYLSRNPAAYDRLAAEIRTAFTSGDEIESGPRLSGCKYLRAVIDETLRIAPPFLGTFWREPYPFYTEPFVVDGQVIPAGTTVGVNPYCLMHNEEYFPAPFEFRPERWLEPSHGETESPEADEARAVMRKAFIPFALGDRNCLGKTLAYSELSMVIAKSLWYFDFAIAPGDAGKLGEGEPGRTDGRHRVGEYQLYDIAGAAHDGPNLVFNRRGEHWKDLTR
jgi:cytochrome P450